jgi:hypothetical protein
VTDAFPVLVGKHLLGDADPVTGGGSEHFTDGPHVTGGGRPILVIIGRGRDSFEESVELGRVIVIVFGGRIDGFLGKGKRKTRLRSVTWPEGNCT